MHQSVTLEKGWKCKSSLSREPLFVHWLFLTDEKFYLSVSFQRISCLKFSVYTSGPVISFTKLFQSICFFGNKVCEFPEVQTAQLPNFTQTMRTFVFDTKHFSSIKTSTDEDKTAVCFCGISVRHFLEAFIVYIRIVLGMPNRYLHKIADWAMIVHNYWKTLPPGAKFRPSFCFL